MLNAPHELCWWLIGADNRSQPIAMAIDHHDVDAALTRGTITFETRRMRRVTALRQAKKIVHRYARKLGVPLSRVLYDPDSTEANRRD